MLGCLVSVYFQPHYLAPAVAPLIALFATYVRSLANDEASLPMLRAVLAWTSIAAWAFPGLAATIGSIPRGPFHVEISDWATARARLADSLASVGGQHLLFVAYPPGYHVHHEWVFNGASTTTQPVIWARDLGVDKDKAVREHFPNARSYVLAVLSEAPFYTLHPFP
jgi:hypothetical protein